jgi:dTDP-4-dehydrorhamnose 3,5-epimerase-like enzyme
MTLPCGLRTKVTALTAHRDARGLLFEPLDDRELGAKKNVHVVLTEPNGVRANHVHDDATETTTVVGPCLARFKEAGSSYDVEVPAGEVYRFVIPPGVIHAFRNTGHGVMMMVSFSSALHDPSGRNSRREELIQAG